MATKQLCLILTTTFFLFCFLLSLSLSLSLFRRNLSTMKKLFCILFKTFPGKDKTISFFSNINLTNRKRFWWTSYVWKIMPHFWSTNLNDESIRLGLFYAKRLGNRIHSTFRFTFLCRFLGVFFFTRLYDSKYSYLIQIIYI